MFPSVEKWREGNSDIVESEAVEAVAQSLKTSSVVLSTRVYSALAGCVIRLDVLPVKLNPVIKPIMDTLKREVWNWLLLIYCRLCCFADFRRYNIYFLYTVDCVVLLILDGTI